MHPLTRRPSAAERRLAVENALLDYAAAADARDAAAIGRMFAAARVTFGGHVVRGALRVEALYRSRLESAPTARHLISNVRVRGAGARELEAECAYVRLAWGAEPEVLSAGEYVARFRTVGCNRVVFSEFTVDTRWSR